VLNCVAALSLREAVQRSIPLPRSCLSLTFATSRTNQDNSRKRFKKRKKKDYPCYYYSEYPKICPIFISSCLVCARACYTPHPSTPFTVSIVFLFISIYFHLSFSIFFSSLSFVLVSTIRCTRNYSLCTRHSFLFYKFYKLISRFVFL